MLVFALAIAAAELFLRLVLPFQLAFGETWFTPGIHLPNPKYGYVFAPNYRGFMFHSDKVTRVPLVHDQYGFRPPGISPQTNIDDQVVLIGGKSVAYCYGLPQEHTLQSEMARAGPCPLQVWSAAWPGFSEDMMFHAYRDFLEPHIAPPKVAMLLLYQVKLGYYADLPADPDLLPPPTLDSSSRYVDGLVLPPRPMPSRLLGAYFYKSYFLARLAANMDSRFSLLSSAEPDGDLERVEQKRLVGLKRFARFVAFMNDYFRQRNTRFAVVALPVWYQDADYTGIKKVLPPNVPYLDLHQELRPHLTPDDFIAGGHFGPRASAQVGHRLAEEACRLLREDNHQ